MSALADCDSYCVVNEEHCDRSLHTHAVFTSEDSWAFVRAYLLQFFNSDEDAYKSYNFDLQEVKKPQKCIDYITKSDTHPAFKNIPTKWFNFHYHLYNFAQWNPIWNPCHPFVVANYQKLSLIQKYHQHHQFLRPSSIKSWPSKSWYSHSWTWKKRVALWLRYVIKSEWYLKRRQLFLFGPVNSGKTYFVSKLLKNLKVFVPCSKSAFPFCNLNNSYHVILIDEFNYRLWPYDFMKLLLQGTSVTFDVKNEIPKTLAWRKPIILISNWSYEILPEAYKARLQAVEAKARI